MNEDEVVQAVVNEYIEDRSVPWYKQEYSGTDSIVAYISAFIFGMGITRIVMYMWG